ncbi:MAG: hypothetical protein PHS44_06835 [Candidatus Dojkabacteria bacterium]|nr:hypothetical protein [Candidatus Dojkabacteria bacterium]
MKKLVIGSLFVSILLFSGLSFTFIINRTEDKTPDSSGSYVISQLQTEGNWEEIHRASYPVKYTQNTFPVEKNSDNIKIRINQEHQPFGDIEMVSLSVCGELISPTYAKRVNTGESVLEDILYDDLNVIVSHENPIELEWSVSSECDNLELTLKANEYTATDKTHFSFPDPNDYVTYDYQLSGSVKVDGEIDEVDGVSTPQHSPYWYPATGHPEGNVYFYLNDDSEYVYLSADIAIDNSDEYGMDWIQIDVYNSTEGEKQEFRVTDLNDTYGKCAFGLTSKVSYKHQTCELRIPKSKINGDSLDFELKYYGTGAPVTVQITDISPATIYPYNTVVSTATITSPGYTVTSAQYQIAKVDGGDIVDSGACSAQDGAFDELTETAVCSTSTVPIDFEITGYRFRVIGTDNQPTNGQDDENFYITEDEGYPTIELDEEIPDFLYDNTPTFTGTATDAEGTPVDGIYFCWAGEESDCTECAADDGTFDEAEEAFTCTVEDEEALPDGEYEMGFATEDLFGNESDLLEYNEKVLLANDEDPPSIDVDTLPQDSTTDTTPTFTGTATDEATTIANVYFQVDSIEGSWLPCTPVDGAFDESEEEFTCSLNGSLIVGPHTIYFRSVDAAGNSTEIGSEEFYIFNVTEEGNELIETGSSTFLFVQIALIALGMSIFVFKKLSHKQFDSIDK